MKNDVTAHFQIPLPHPENELQDDVLRMRASLEALDLILSLVQLASEKDASGGYAGLIGQAINLWNSGKTFHSTFSFEGTAHRTHALQNKSGTLALTSDITGLNSGTNTGDETLATLKTKLGVTTLSGSNTGDQTNVSGSSGSCTGNATTASNAARLAMTNWVIEEVTGVLYFKYGGVAKAKLDSAGNFTALANVSGYTAP